MGVNAIFASFSALAQRPRRDHAEAEQSRCLAHFLSKENHKKTHLRLDYIPITGTALSAQELCDLLNCKLSQSNAV